VRYLLAAFIGGTLAVAAYIELSARRGVAAGYDEYAHATDAAMNYGDGYVAGLRNADHWDVRRWVEMDDWATDPRTAELATGGGQEGAGR
jgi:hypothetical protein